MRALRMSPLAACGSMVRSLAIWPRKPPYSLSMVYLSQKGRMLERSSDSTFCRRSCTSLPPDEGKTIRSSMLLKSGCIRPSMLLKSGCPRSLAFGNLGNHEPNTALPTIASMPASSSTAKAQIGQRGHILFDLLHATGSNLKAGRGRQFLGQNTLDRNFLPSIRGRRHDISLNRHAVHGEGDAIAVAFSLDGDGVNHSAEDSRRGKSRPGFGNHRGNLQAVESGAHAENPLRDGVVVPRRRAGEPG